MYQARIQRTFCAAHALKLPDGAFEPLHGHNWQVTVTIAAGQLDELETVVDFHWLQEQLDAVLESACNANLNHLPPFAGPDGALKVNPSAERVAWWIATALMPKLPRHLRLVQTEVTEAPGCSAVYQP